MNKVILTHDSVFMSIVGPRDSGKNKSLVAHAKCVLRKIFLQRKPTAVQKNATLASGIRGNQILRI